MRRSAAARVFPIGYLQNNRFIGSRDAHRTRAPASHKVAKASPGGSGLRTPLSRHMRRYREPPSVPTRPDVGIAAIPLLAIRCGIAGARVNDRDIADNAHFDVLCREAADRH